MPTAPTASQDEDLPPPLLPDEPEALLDEPLPPEDDVEDVAAPPELFLSDEPPLDDPEPEPLSPEPEPAPEPELDPEPDPFDPRESVR